MQVITTQAQEIPILDGNMENFLKDIKREQVVRGECLR